MKEIKGVITHGLRFRQELSSGKFAELPLNISVDVSGQAVYVEFEKLPRITFSIEDLTVHSYDMLEAEGYVKDGKRTDKEYDFTKESHAGKEKGRK